MKKLAFWLVIANVLVACDTTAPKLTPRAREGQREKPRAQAMLLAEKPEMAIDTRVDILFIVDNSKSMAKNIINVSNNIELFVRELAKKNLVDFHIGYTFVHDRSVPKICPKGSDAQDRQNWDDPGTLQPMVGLDPSLKRRFVTRDDKFGQILKDTFTPAMIKPFVPVTSNPNICAQGAENEESVTPLLGAILPSPLTLDPTYPNAGFRRKGAKFVAIILSDAKDAAIADGKITIDEVIDKLSAATDSTPQERNFRVFSVVVKPKSVQRGNMVSFNKQSCTPDPAFKILNAKGQPEWPIERTITLADNPLAQLAVRTEDEGSDRIDQVLSICDVNYGQALADYGTQIQKDSIRDMRIKLNSVPQQFEPGSADDADKGLAVFLGDKNNPANRLANNQWKAELIGNDYVITVFSRKIDWASRPGQGIQIRYVPVNLSSGDARRI